MAPTLASARRKASCVKAPCVTVTPALPAGSTALFASAPQSRVHVLAAAITRSPRRCAVAPYRSGATSGCVPLVLRPQTFDSETPPRRSGESPVPVGPGCQYCSPRHPFKLQFPSAARASPLRRPRHRLRRRRGGVAARRCNDGGKIPARARLGLSPFFFRLVLWLRERPAGLPSTLVAVGLISPSASSSSACFCRNCSRRPSFSCSSSSIRPPGVSGFGPAIPNYVNPRSRICPAGSAQVPLINYLWSL